uniref:lysine transporter LysE n=1 Tax=Flavobacterium sp. TaxID=239 RepID=UPI004049172D
MTIGISLLSGFLAATIGTIMPGLINMTAVKVNHQNGTTRALWFLSGATIIVFFQSLVAVLFARFLSNRIDIMNILQEIGFVLFLVLTFVFFRLAFKKNKKVKKKKEEIKLRSKSSRFFLGALISVVNVFPIPYYVFISVSLASYKYFSFTLPNIYAFAIGATLGSFFVFYTYIVAFHKFENKLLFISKNINLIIGSVTGIVAIMSLVNILKS